MIIPGILEESEEAATNKIYATQNFASCVHIDIADGILVEGKTFANLTFLNNLNTFAQLELHLMVINPQDFVIPNLKNVKRIYAQIEAVDGIEDFVLKAFDAGYEVGLSVNPQTGLAALRQLLRQLGTKIMAVQFMAVLPGAQGRAFDETVIEKMKEFKKEFTLSGKTAGFSPRMSAATPSREKEETSVFRPKSLTNFLVQIDGGINGETLPKIIGSGFDNVVIGSAIVKSEDPQNAYKGLLNILEKGMMK